MNIFKHRTSVDKTEKVVAPPFSEKQQEDKVATPSSETQQGPVAKKTVILEWDEDSDTFKAHLDCTLGEFINTQYKIIVPSDEFDEHRYGDRWMFNLKEGYDLEWFKTNGEIKQHSDLDEMRYCNLKFKLIDTSDAIEPTNVELAPDHVFFELLARYEGEEFVTVVLQKSDDVGIDLEYGDSAALDITFTPVNVYLESQL